MNANEEEDEAYCPPTYDGPDDTDRYCGHGEWDDSGLY